MKTLLSLLFALPLFAAAQAGSGVQKFYAFRAIHYSGNIPVDDNGHPLDDGIDTVYLVVAEMNRADTATVRFSGAYAGGRWHSLAVHAGKTGKIVVGYNPDKQQDITVTAAPGKILVQMDFVAGPYAPLPKGLKPSQILLKGSHKNKPATWTITAVRSMPPVYYP